MKKTTLIAIGLASLLGISACSSGNKLSVTTSKSNTDATSVSSADTSSGDSTSSGDTSGGNDTGTVPNFSGVPGLSENCAAYLQAITSAFTPDKNGSANIADAFKQLESQVPDNLKDDVRVLADGFSKLQGLYEKYNYDYAKIAADPTAATLFSDNKFTEASSNITAWLDTECPSGS